MAEQDPLEYTSQRFESIKKEALDAIRGTADLDEGWEKAQKAAEEYYSQMKQQKALVKQLGKEYEEVFKKAEKRADKFVKPIEKITGLFKKFPIDKFFDQDKIEGALSTLKTDMVATFEQSGGGFSDSITGGITEGLITAKGSLGAFANFGKNMLKAFTGAKAVLAGAGGLILLIGGGLWNAIKKVDAATADLVSETGILDDRLSGTLIRATENSAILGGNVQLAADAAKEIVNQFSVAVPLTSKLVGTVATLSERFGLGNEKATKLVRIISERIPGSLDKASDMATSFVEGLGRIGPAVIGNIVENYEQVNNNFGLSIEQLRTQGHLATQLGLSLGTAAEVSEGLLDISSSLTSQFKASALLGQTLNLQRARQLAFEGDIVGANQEILDQVEQIGDISKLNTFQRRALAEATGKTVSELQRELNIRKQIGNQGRIQAAQRESVLGKFEAISRRISSVFFRIFSSEAVQTSVEKLADSVVRLLEGDTISRFVSMLSNVVEAIGKLISGSATLGFNVFTGFSFNDKSAGVSLDDGIITNRGEVVSTNPKDYIIATQTPGDLVSDGDKKGTKEVMEEVRGLLKYLKENGVKGGDVYMDGRKVSKQVANAIR